MQTQAQSKVNRAVNQTAFAFINEAFLGEDLVIAIQDIAAESGRSEPSIRSLLLERIEDYLQRLS